VCCDTDKEPNHKPEEDQIFPLVDMQQKSVFNSQRIHILKVLKMLNIFDSYYKYKLNECDNFFSLGGSFGIILKWKHGCVVS
jgi:hypothetical protein